MRVDPGSVFIFFLALSAVPGFAQEQAKLTNSLQFAYVDTSGNNKTRSASLSDNTIWRFARDYALGLEGRGYWTEAGQTTAAEWYSASARLDRKVKERFYVFTLGGWERNRFAGVARRTHEDAGVGYVLFNLERQQLRVELAEGYMEERHTDATVIASGQSRQALTYNLKLWEATTFSQEVENFYEFNDSGDPRWRTMSNLNIPMNKHAGAQFSCIYMYRGRPPAGFVKIDRIYTSGFYVRF